MDRENPEDVWCTRGKASGEPLDAQAQWFAAAVLDEQHPDRADSTRESRGTRINTESCGRRAIQVHWLATESSGGYKTLQRVERVGIAEKRGSGAGREHAPMLEQRAPLTVTMVLLPRPNARMRWPGQHEAPGGSSPRTPRSRKNRELPVVSESAVALVGGFLRAGLRTIGARAAHATLAIAAQVIT